MSAKVQQYRNERNRAKLRADGSWQSLVIWGAVGLMTLGGVGGALYSILMSIK